MIIGKIYKRDGSSFFEYQTLEHDTDAFQVVDADATRIIAGNALTNMARTWLFSGGSWAEEQTFLGADDFGCSVSISGPYLVIGASGAGGGAGKVAFYTWPEGATSWVFRQDLYAQAGELFGYAVRVRGNRIIAAAKTTDNVSECTSLQLYTITDWEAELSNIYYNFEGAVPGVGGPGPIVL